jgi:hypothetical protein
MATPHCENDFRLGVLGMYKELLNYRLPSSMVRSWCVMFRSVKDLLAPLFHRTEVQGQPN